MESQITKDELLALMRLVRFIIRTSSMHDSIWMQNIIARDALFVDEATIDEAIERLEKS